MTDLEIARGAQILPIALIAESLGLDQEQLELYGHYKAKLPLSLIDEEKIAQNKLVLVSAISPTPAGEGKTTVSIGLSDALNQIGKRAVVVLREPSLGPVFGIKGGATGGGKSQLLPMEDINLHFTGDFSAVEKAHNLLAALIDNHLQRQHKENLQIDPRTIAWKRVMDMNDRSLRQVMVGLGGTNEGVPRQTGFDITAASEIMAILCLADSLTDLKRRMGSIFVGYTYDKQPVYARDLKAEGAMATLLKDAIKPNLVQTLEGNPAIIHGGPFANIAQGTNTVIATKTGMSLGDYTITEGGFGFDLGAEKFYDIKCQSAGLRPDALVMTVTIRALKYHGGVKLADLKKPDVTALIKGLPNLEKHLENARKFGVPPIIALNRFATDSEEEIAVIEELGERNGIPVAVADVWAKGGSGAIELAAKLVQLIEEGLADFRPLYKWEQDVRTKIETIAKEIYGADNVRYSDRALQDLRRIEHLGLQGLPICIAKTQKSLSDDPTLLGRPTGFDFKIREIEIAAGAGFIIPIAGDMMRMPGLPAKPAAHNIDIDDDGHVSGLF